MKTSEQINEIATALSKAQGHMKPAAKDALNPHFKSKFADFASVWEAIREPMTSNGLTVLQDVFTEEKGVSVLTRIIHTSGQWIEFGPLTIPVNKYDAHGVGSATSYAKRYALCAAIGVVGEEDDDGNKAASGKLKATITDEAYKQFVDKHASEYGDSFNLFVSSCLDNSDLSKKEMVASFIKNYDYFKKKIQEFSKKGASDGCESKRVQLVPQNTSNMGISTDDKI